MIIQCHRTARQTRAEKDRYRYFYWYFCWTVSNQSFRTGKS